MKYSDNRNVQIVLYLLKAHGIKKVIASPGTINMSLVVSMQHDLWFEMYSAPDERSAAYMACGLAAESGEPVVLSCTGATASRNYIPGLTEAFYRKLPVLAITSTERLANIGHNIPQVIDRTAFQNDVLKLSVLARAIYNDEDAWDCMIQVNKAILELSHKGGGPVHINLERIDGDTFSANELCHCRVIKRYTLEDNFPNLCNKKVAVFVGSHKIWTAEQTLALDTFCKMYGAIVFCDHTSNYHGKYRFLACLVATQDWCLSKVFESDVVIHIGEISGDSRLQGKLKNSTSEIWRVSEDGLIRDTLRKLTKVFEMSESAFFSKMSTSNVNMEDMAIKTLNIAHKENDIILEKIPNTIPFSNIWIASQLADKLPNNSVIHFGILNSLRSWNLFELNSSICCSSNVGGFGIDGCMSTLIGSSLANPQKLHFGVFGDLAFFYDMNSLGNRHVGKNLRILLVNNAEGAEFKLYQHPASKLGGEEDEFIAAAGHYGNQSPNIVRHYAQDLGFEYMSASSKSEFMSVYKNFVDVSRTENPIVFEIFVKACEDSLALKTINEIEISDKDKLKGKVRGFIGDKLYEQLSKLKP